MHICTLCVLYVFSPVVCKYIYIYWLVSVYFYKVKYMLGEVWTGPMGMSCGAYGACWPWQKTELSYMTA